MARVKKIKDVKKFGGVDELGTVKLNGHEHETSHVEAKSEKTHLEDDHGEGNAVVIRCFTFAFNLEHPEAILERRPTKQDLFNAHIKGIEMALFKDGLKPYVDVAPRITFDSKKLQYNIFVPAVPMKGWMLNERPQTLTEIAHG